MVANTSNSSDDPCGPSNLFAPVRSIRLRTAIPGPISIQHAARYAQVTGHAPPPVMIARAHGALLYDVDGNILIDFVDGLLTGHTPDDLMDTLRSRLEQGLGASNLPDEAAMLLCERLNTVVPCAKPAHTRLFQTDGDAYHATETLSGHYRVADERRTGFGRTGSLFAFQRGETTPDLVVVGRTLAAGLPFGAVTGRSFVIDLLPAADGRVTPLACAAALLTLETVLRDDLPRRAGQLEAIIREQVDDWRAEFPFIIALQGDGIELTLKTTGDGIATQIASEALRCGLVVTAEGADVLLRPPLMLPEEQLYEGLDALDVALRAVANAR